MVEQEIELGWLIKNMPANLESLSSIDIVQAYLENNDPDVKDMRVRKKGSEFTLTIKRFLGDRSETGFSSEENKSITSEEFDTYLQSSKKVVHKVRYFYPLENGLKAEIDVYQDHLKGLEVVEVEFPNLEALKAFNKPEWFDKEVTDSEGIYPPIISGLTIEEVKSINDKYIQKPHFFEI